MTENERRPEHVDVAGPAADAMIRLALDRVPVPAIEFAPLRSGRWGNIAFDGYEGWVSLEGAVGKIRCAARNVADPFRDFTFKHRILPSTFELEDGSTLTGEMTYLRERGGLQFDGRTRPGVVIDLDGWVWNPGVEPAVWVGRLPGAAFKHPNLCVQKSWDHFSFQHVRLGGQADWHLLKVKGEDDCVLVLDPKAHPVTRQSLFADFLAAQFAIGTRMALDYLVGVDTSLRPVTGMGLGFGAHQRTDRRCPVPETLENRECWFPVLFGYVARKLAKEGVDNLLAAINAYLYGMTLDVDMGYLCAQVGLEAFSSTLVGAAAPTVLVKDSARWERWVSESVDAIKAHATDKTAATKLVNKVKSAQQAPTGDRVEAALKHFHLEVPAEALKEIGRRGRSAHRLFMSEPEAGDLQGDLDRRDIILTLLTALVAQYVGYKGPIAGWVTDPYGYQPCADWWPYRGEDEHLMTFITARSREGEDG